LTFDISDSHFDLCHVCFANEALEQVNDALVAGTMGWNPG